MISFKIGKKTIGRNHPTYFIADVAANHDGSLERAKKLIYLCAEAGVDAVKFQNFHAEKIVSDIGFKKLKKGLSHQSAWKKSVFEVYEHASICEDWTPILKETCVKACVEYFTSPYDFESVDLVSSFVNIYKIGSGDITWLEMIDYIAKKGKPVALATGASTLEDVKRAMQVLQKRNKKIILMQCNTNYTAARENFRYLNLNVLKTYAKLYPDVILGLSDHAPGYAAVLGAVTIGAKVIEKHFTDDNTREGPDHKFALNPKTYKEMVDAVRELELALGNGVKKIEDNEKETAIVQRRSLRAGQNFLQGHIFVKNDFFPLRPISKAGFPPYKIQSLVGKRLKKDIKKGEEITSEYL